MCLAIIFSIFLKVHVFDFVKVISLNQNSKYLNSPFLIHYWPFNSHIQDVIGGAHLFNGKNAGLTSDRFGRSLSALSLSNGHYQIPPGNYFSTGQFTITFWLKTRTFKLWSRLIDFSNGPLIDSIFFNTLDSQNNCKFKLYNLNTVIGFQNSSKIPLNTWTHVSLTYGKTNILSIYYNGTIQGSSLTSQALNNKTRLYNFIGRSSNYAVGDPDIDAILDELKIFNKELNQKEVELEMINN